MTSLSDKSHKFLRLIFAMLLITSSLNNAGAQTEPELVRSEIGDKASAKAGRITITNI